MSGIKIQDKRPTSLRVEKEPDVLEALWRFFSSMRTAIVLLLLLSAASIAGPRIESATGNPIYGSWWYSTLLLAVGISLAVSSIRSLGLAWRRTFHPNVATTPGQVALLSGSETLECAGTPDAVVEKASQALRSRRYQVLTQSSGKSVSIHAMRGQAGTWGAVLTNLGLVLVFAGLIIGHPIGSGNYVKILEGKRAAGYHRQGVQQHVDLPFEIGLKDLMIETDKDRKPVGYKSDLQIFEGGREVAGKVVDDDHPLTYKGLSFRQADYGLVGLVLKVTAPDGKSAFLGWDIRTESSEQGRTYALADQPLHQFPLSGKDLTLYVHNLVPDYVGGEKVNRSALPVNPAVEVLFNDIYKGGQQIQGWTPLGWMTVGKRATVKGHTVSLERVVSYTVLQVSKDRDLTLVYAGLVLAVLGGILSFLVKYRVIRVSVSPARSVSNVAIGVDSPSDAEAFDADLRNLREALA